ncbi:MAG: hypothetical protein WC607_01620 [Candidatus Micrarchaeia archaeon]
MERAPHLALMLLLLVSSFAPFAYAETPAAEETEAVTETPTETSVEGCANTIIHSLSDEDRQRLWDATVGFKAEEINDLTPEQNAYDTDEEFTNPMQLAVAPAGSQQDKVDFRSFAAVMGITGEEEMRELATQLGVNIGRDDIIPNDATVLVSRASLYANNRGKKSEFMEALSEWGLVDSGATGLPAASPLPYADLKISLPGSGSQIALSDLYKLNPLDNASCMLGDTIQGRVTYAGLLNKDVAYCGEQGSQCYSGEYISPATDDVEDELMPEDRANQHFTGASVTGYLDLGSGANILIPSFYENWITHFSKINGVQFYAALISSLSTISHARNLEQTAELKKDLMGQQSQSVNALSEAIRAPGLKDADFADMNKAFAGARGTFDNLNTEYKEAKTMLSTYNKVNRLASSTLTASVMLGFSWLGPARLMFEANDGILLNTAGGVSDQYLKVVVNRKPLEKFRSASNPWGTGKVQELLADWTGVAAPAKAFELGKVFVINKVEPANEIATVTSLTAVTPYGAGWRIATNWDGSSSSVNFEDLRKLKKDEKYTSMGFIVNELLPEAVINQKVNGDAYKYITALALPFILSRNLPSAAGNILGISVMMTGFSAGMSIDKDYGKDVVCEASVLSNLKSVYAVTSAAATAADVYLTAFGGASRITLSLTEKWRMVPVTFNAAGEPTKYVNIFRASQQQVSSQAAKSLALSKATFLSKTLPDIVNSLNPITAFQVYWGNRAMQYVSTCKDPQYKILAYAPLSIEASQEAGSNPLQQIQDLADQLNIGQAAQNSFAPVNTTEQLDRMQDVLSFRAVLENQVGAVEPEEIYYFQIEESAWSVQGGLFDKLAGNGCEFNENYDNGALNFNLGSDGVTVYNEDGSVRLALNDYWNSVRALSRMRSQENGRVILPNKIVEHTYMCEGEFVSVDGDGSATLSGDCDGACLAKALAMVANRDEGLDLSAYIGTISSVDTDKGIASFSSGTIRFLTLYPDEGEAFGVETTAPGYELMGGLASRQELRASKLTVNGDGSVMLSGAGTPETTIGSIRTIIGDKGKMEFSSDGRVLVFIYSLASMSAQNLRAVETALEDGEMNLGVDAKTGAEEDGAEINAALDAIQGEGGLDTLETDSHEFYFDGNTLRVIDKATGEATDYTITGREDLGNGQFAYDTDQGRFNFGFDVENGQPMLSAQGPNGLDEVLALLAARGDDGMLTFNPSTGAINVYNGQDIPLSADYMSKGIGFMADENGGTRGVPATNPFTQAWSTSGSGNRTGLNLPSWPEEQPLLALMLALILAGVALVRRQGRY